MGGGRVVGSGGCGGREVGSSTMGGGDGEDGYAMGRGVSSGGEVLSSLTGGATVGVSSTANAEHFKVGFPVVPGGHLQTILCASV